MPYPPESEQPLATDGLDDRAIDEVVARGPLGAVAVAGVSTFIVVVIVLLFYFFAYLPRGIIQ